jgi:catechol 2,3-dioxygenase-like lactoylglutathione lyase family enzyme
MTIKVRGMAPLIQVFDMPTSVAFYRELLGFELIGRSDPDQEWAFAMLQLDDAVLMLNTVYEEAERPEAPDPARVAAHVDVALYFGAPDVDAVYEHLRAKGLAVEPPTITSYGFRVVIVRDPDNYALCFQWPVAEPA